MKTVVRAAVLFLFCAICSLGAYAQGVVFEDLLEGRGSFLNQSIPVGWKEESSSSGDAKWHYHKDRDATLDFGQGAETFADGSWFHLPLHAKDSNYYACVKYGEEMQLTLYTPLIKLAGTRKPILSFYYVSPDGYEEYAAYKLDVCYRLSQRDSWEVLRTFQHDAVNWTLAEIPLPLKYEGSNTKYQKGIDIDEIQIGFRVTTNQQGAGLGLDVIKIENRVTDPLKVSSVELWNNKIVCPTGTDVNPIAGVKLGINGNSGEFILKRADFEYTGDAISDVKNFRLYYTTDSIFEPSICLAQSATLLNNSIQFDNINYSINVLRKCFLWLCADIKNATDINGGVAHGRKISVKFKSNAIETITNGVSSSLPVEGQTSEGHSITEESLRVESFEGGLPANWQKYAKKLIEGTTNWESTTDPGDWAVGVPGGGGVNAPTIAYAGSKVLATNLNGNYRNDIKHIVDAYISNKADVRFYKDVKLHYARQLNINFMDHAMIICPEIPNLRGVLGDTIWSNGAGAYADRRWVREVVQIERATRNVEPISLSMHLYSAAGAKNNPTPDGWNIDNFAITGNRIDYDLAIVKIEDFDKCGLANTQQIKFTARNSGYYDVKDPKFAYSLNNGGSWIEKQFTGVTLKSPRISSINSEIEKEFIFDNVQFTTGQKQLIVKVVLPEDEDDSNDSKSMNFMVFPSLSGEAEYQYGFAKTSGNMYSDNSTWVYGLEDSLVSGQKVGGWITKPNAYYGNNLKATLESPCFDLAGMEYPVFSFVYALDLQNGDKLRVQKSTDDGKNWSDIPSGSIYKKNWQPNGWEAGQNTRKLDTAYTDLGNVTGNIKFRFLLETNASDTALGAFIANMGIAPIPYDIEAQIVSPVSACNIGVTPVKIKIINKGRRTITAGTRIPTFVVIDGGTNFDTLVVPSNIASEASLDINSLRSYDFAKKQDYTIGARVRLQPLMNNLREVVSPVGFKPGDKTTHTPLLEYGNPKFTLGPDIGTTNPEAVTITASELGYNPKYTWEKFTYNKSNSSIDVSKPSTWGSTWQEIGGQTGNSLPANTLQSGEYGLIAVSVTNDYGCVYKDTIWVLNSNQDILIENKTLNYNVPESACEHPNPVEFSVNVVFEQGDNFAENVDSIPVGISVNDKNYVEYVMIDGTQWEAMGADALSPVDKVITHTFKPIDLSARGEYKIKAYTLLGSDIDRTNDSSNVVTITTIGTPGAMISEALLPTISMSPATGKTLTAVSEVESSTLTYTWTRELNGATEPLTAHQNTAMLQQLIIPDNHSVLYKVVINDESNNCGSSEASVFVKTTDIEVQAIEEPNPIICISDEHVPVTVILRNVSDDPIPAGTALTVKAESKNGQSTSKTVILGNELEGKGTYQVPLDTDDWERIMGAFIIEASVSMDGDVEENNNSKVVTINVVERPWVKMPFDTLIKAFTSETEYTIIPDVSENVVSYSWTTENGEVVMDRDGNSDGATFIIKGQPKPIYVVTVSNGYCTETDTMVVLSKDISISILSPTDTCSWKRSGNAYPIKVRITNQGTDLSGGQVKITGQAVISGNEQTLAAGVFSLPDDFKSGEYMDVEMPTKLNLEEEGYVKITLLGTCSGFVDAIAANNNALHTAFALGYPQVEFADLATEAILEDTITLQLKDKYPEIKWYFLSDGNLSNKDSWFGPDDKVISRDTLLGLSSKNLKEAYVVAYATNWNGCSETSEPKKVFFHTHDLMLSQLLEPISSCSLPEGQVVKVRVTNNGDYTMPVGSKISMGLKISPIMNTEVKDELILSEELGEGQSVEFSFANPVDMSSSQVYTVTTRVTADNDRITNNNELTTTVENYKNIVLDEFVNIHNACRGTEYTFDVKSLSSVDTWLYEEKGTPRYEWSTGDQTPSTTVVSNSDLYSDDVVEYTIKVTNGVGCSKEHKFEITYNALPKLEFKNDQDQPLTWLHGCEGIGLFIGTAASTNCTYSWESGETTSQITARQTGTYTVTAVRSDASQCQNTNSVDITIHPLPSIDMGGVTAMCDGNPFTISVSADVTTFSWILPDGSGSNERNLLVNREGQYVAQVEDIWGCSNRDTAIITSKPSPKNVKIDQGSEQTVCADAEFTLTASGDGDNLRYKWSTGHLGTSVIVKEPKQYTVTAYNDYGCSATSDAFTLSNYTKPDISVDTECKGGDNVRLTVKENDVTIKWSTGATTASIDATIGNSYSVDITDKNNGCTFTEHVVPSKPQVSIAQLNTLCENASATLKASIDDAKSYTWQGVSSNAATADISKAGEYGVTVVTSNNCEASATINVTAKPAPEPKFKQQGNKLVVEGGTFSSVKWNTGETGNSIVLGNTGTSYEVIVTNADGCQAKAQFTYTSVAPRADVLEAEVRAFPNPASKMLNVRIDTDKPETYEMVLYSPVGATVWQRMVHVDDTRTVVIDVEQLPAGIYMLRVSADNRAAVLKIAVE